jgi:sulfur carrier protein
MEIHINNQLKTFPEQELTVQELLHQEIPGKQQGIAIAINNRVIAKNQWERTPVTDKDQITIIRATQGG